ncbi:MAG TPA: hypothetical protein VMX17_03340 [Candidatus Glassbacteria bacterium]|nr:hypothetical protein [Candidatus Glassbacteria bacterium]
MITREQLYNIDKKRPYKCSKCNLENVKLWRQYNTLACYIELLCAKCATSEFVDENGRSLCGLINMKTDQIENEEYGSLVPAIPTADGTDTYWGYTSVPENGVIWWKSLSTYEGQTLDLKELIIKHLKKTENHLIRLVKTGNPISDLYDENDITNLNLDACEKEVKIHSDYLVQILGQSSIDVLRCLDEELRNEFINEMKRV